MGRNGRWRRVVQHLLTHTRPPRGGFREAGGYGGTFGMDLVGVPAGVEPGDAFQRPTMRRSLPARYSRRMAARPNAFNPATPATTNHGQSNLAWPSMAPAVRPRAATSSPQRLPRGGAAGGIFGMDLARVSVEVNPAKAIQRATRRRPIPPRYSRRLARCW